MCLGFYFIWTDVRVSFSQSAYSANEDYGFVQIELITQIPSTTDTAVGVFSTETSANGKN